MLRNLSDITLVIVTWNGDDMLKTLLDSIIRVYGDLPETIIVDNANADSTRELISRYKNATLVQLPENRGFAGGNNAALPYCKRKYIVFLNNDLELTGDSISPLVDFLEQNPEVAVTQGKVVLASNGLLDGCGGFFSPLGILAFQGAFVKDEGQFDTPGRVFTVGGAFFAIRRSVIDKVGGLFYDHFKSYYEEIDLCHRINIAGFECWYIPTPKVLHRHSATMSKFRYFDIKRQYYRNIWFSLLTCHGTVARFYFGTVLLLLSLAQSMSGLLKLNTENIKAHFFAAKNIFSCWKDILHTRNRIKRLRKVKDRQLLHFAVKRQPFSYYRNLFKR